MYRRGGRLSRRSGGYHRRRLGLRSRRLRFRRRYHRTRLNRFGRRRFSRYGRYKGSLRSRKHTRARKTTSHYSKVNAKVFPKISKSFRTRINDALQPLQIFTRQSFNKLAPPLEAANFGKVCWWCIPYSTDSINSAGLITAAAQFYPLMDADITTMYDRMFGATTTWPIGSVDSIVFPYTTNPNSRPGNAGTVRPLDQQKFRMGMYYTYTLSNSSNVPIEVKAFKWCPRRDMDKLSFSPNILAEYLSGLWNSGVGTGVAGTLTESAMNLFFHDNIYDLFDAPQLLEDVKVLKTFTFLLKPLQTRSFSVRVPARTWRMRRFVNDFIGETGPVSADYPYYRYKGVPEYIFKCTNAVLGSSGTNNLYPNATYPDYSVTTGEVISCVNLEYQIKYFCKPQVIPTYQYSSGIAITGQAATVVGNKAVVNSVDTASVPQVV